MDVVLPRVQLVTEIGGVQMFRGITFSEKHARAIANLAARGLCFPGVRCRPKILKGRYWFEPIVHAGSLGRFSVLHDTLGEIVGVLQAQVGNYSVRDLSFNTLQVIEACALPLPPGRNWTGKFEISYRQKKERR